MNMARVFAVAVLLAAEVSGCALGGPDLIEPQDSLPRAGVLEKRPSRWTSLMVATETYLDYNLSDSDEGSVYHHTGYTIYDAGGRKLQYVRNWIGNADTSPSEILLEPGRYLVLLEKPYDRSPLFWVSIVDERRTWVDVRHLPPAPR